MRSSSGDGQRRRWVRRAAALVLVLGLVPGARAEEMAPLRVGTSADYAPFSRAGGDGGDPEGFDVDLLRAWAAERGRELEFVRFRWPQLVADLAAERFDVAASGVTVLPERSAAGRFTVPVAETSAWALASSPERWSQTASLDRPQIRIAVNAGGHLEQVARARFPRATLVAVPDNDAVIELLIGERVQAVVTDDVEAPIWEARAAVPLARIGPLSRDRKAWLVRSGLPELAADLDAWLLAQEADGRLASLRAKWLGEASVRTAEPLGALLAAIDERLSLMPWVGVVKRRNGTALSAPAREALVIDRALADVRAAATSAGKPPPSEPAVRALFRSQIDTAMQVQARAVADDAFAPSALPDLDTALRPALLRIGTRIAELLLVLPPGLDPASVRATARTALRARYLEDGERDAIADAIAACSASAPATLSE